MKKFVSLLMTVVMLAAMFTVFAIPAAALDLSGELSGTYDDSVTINGDATVISGKNIVFNKALTVNFVRTLTVESGASVTAKSSTTVQGKLIVKSGGTVEFFNYLKIDTNATLEIGGTLKGEWSASGTPSYTQNITLLHGGKIEVKFADETKAKTFAEGLKNYKTTVTKIYGKLPYLVTAEYPCQHDQGFTADGICNLCQWQCTHDQGFTADGKCKICQWQCTHEKSITRCAVCDKEMTAETETTPETTPETEPPTASTLSEGSLTIIVGVAAAVVFGLGGFFLGRKKKKNTVEE